MPDPSSFRTIIDLTHNLNDRSPNWEGTVESPYRATELGNIERDGYYSRIFTTQEHYGTHLDAPAHFAAGAWTVEQIPAERLVRPLAVIDVRKQCAGNADYEVSLADISAWEREHGAIPNGAVVLANTGWDAKWNSSKQFRNELSDGLTHYPGFSLEAAKLLVKERGVVGLGIDTMSVEMGATTTYPVHCFTSREGVYHLENLTNLAQVPAAGAMIVIAPVKLEKGSGAPARVFALIS
jgi:kynurenine formamidase